MDLPGPLSGPQGAGGPGGLLENVFGGPDDQGVGRAFDGGWTGFGKVGGPGLETVGKGVCD